MISIENYWKKRESRIHESATQGDAGHPQARDHPLALARESGDGEEMIAGAQVETDQGIVIGIEDLEVEATNAEGINLHTIMGAEKAQCDMVDSSRDFGRGIRVSEVKV
mmetsp:Transcript_1849/g.4254  ORF Transcript_1849/g.4254 Transcript_1849/m.4254 type:complete len:109 (-) Transcript_1849:162-488(-)